MESWAQNITRFIALNAIGSFKVSAQSIDCSAFQQQQQLRVIGRQIKTINEEKPENEVCTETDSSNSELDEAKRRRTRTNFTQWQINELEKAFS